MLADIKSLLWPTSPLDFWTMLLGVATIALVVVAARGLRSLRLAKTEMVTRSRREARDSAIKRCEEFASKIIKMNAAVLKDFAANKITVFARSLDQVRFDPDDQKDLAAARTWFTKLPGQIQNQCIDFLNALEAWAMYFTSGVSDHEVASEPLATPFCAMVVEFYAVLLFLRSASPGYVSAKFPNIVKLYKSWAAVLHGEAMKEQAGNLVAQLQRLQQQTPKGLPLPPPIGTDI